MADDQYGRFASAYDSGRAQIVFRRVVADLETPIGAYLKLSEGRKNTFLLESVQDGAIVGRYSMIGFDPDIILKVEAGKASINRNAGLDPDGFTPVAEAPLDVLRALVAESQADAPEGLPSRSRAFMAISATRWCGAWRCSRTGTGRCGRTARHNADAAHRCSLCSIR